MESDAASISSTLTFLRHADFVVTIAVDSAVLCFSFTAYRRTGMRAFAFWIASCTIAIISSVGLHTYSSPGALSTEAYRSFMEFYRFGYIVAAVLGGAGSIMLIRHVLDRLPSGTPPNEPLQPTAAAPPSLDIPGQPAPPASASPPSGGCG